MWEERAERARREIAALAAAGTGLGELYAAALGLVQQQVPFEQGCWAGVDPGSLVMTSVVNWRDWGVTEEYAARFAETEYAGQEPNRFAELSRRPRPVARISDAPHRDVMRSVRINDILKPLGLEHELRTVFRVDEACWGVGSIFREPGRDFSDREVEFLAAVAATLAAASRIAVRTAHAGRPTVGGPVIVVAGPRGDLRAATAAAVAWLAEVEDSAPGRFTMTLHSAVAQAHASGSGTARARMRDARNNWVVLQASRLITGDDPEQMVVTVEPATTHDLASLLLAAYGVTPREQEVCVEVLSGKPTADIAARLYISPHTVHDHLKSVYAKVGVGSRGELVAKLVV
ncbi:LuxR C-terminal-related transcriptional regulator [Pseudarthrobacter sp. H3Y2-7]|uniref:helix-turn-helix transcriptional regulator n=1 Tax=Pseudarthrobacter naphthalenicus TaxID=3031328 RepID=UPI0023B0E0F8|nr:LuxR C-terminal-related transcriptional regulator [Pseudarthrobacter sp. H3Y2-7]MDE8669909.1 LuxR C-terminal-related transcriptional regulator [Pseudarthrobacter sp. H3Y2-7]